MSLVDVYKRQEYIRPKIKEILERNQQHLSWSNRNIIDNLQDKETVYAFHMSDHTQFYMYISPSLLSLSANLKRGSGIREGLVIADNCIYFLSKKKNKGNYYCLLYTSMEQPENYAIYCDASFRGISVGGVFKK